ncbi:NADH dehydrogenase FAD-containing subunit [Neobacillus niacini]|nr:FAD-dependent oxidoreductase [Neobacillus niacini]MDR6998789.1 NADH dehydrogenase FAD-containing subunit [Neobacillus niacini]
MADQKGLKTPSAEVVLINQQSRLLPYLPKKVSCQIEKRLNKLGVRILHKVKVNHVEKNKIVGHDGSEILSHYSIWTVGLKSQPCLQKLGLPLENNGKILIDSWRFSKLLLHWPQTNGWGRLGAKMGH